MSPLSDLNAAPFGASVYWGPANTWEEMIWQRLFTFVHVPFTTDTAARHQGAIDLLWLHLRGAVLSSILIKSLTVPYIAVVAPPKCFKCNSETVISLETNLSTDFFDIFPYKWLDEMTSTHLNKDIYFELFRHPVLWWFKQRYFTYFTHDVAFCWGTHESELVSVSL